MAIFEHLNIFLIVAGGKGFLKNLLGVSVSRHLMVDGRVLRFYRFGIGEVACQGLRQEAAR